MNNRTRKRARGSRMAKQYIEITNQKRKSEEKKESR